MAEGLPPTLQQAKTQISESTNLDPKPPFSRAPPIVDMSIPNGSPNVGSIHIKPIETTHKHNIEEAEVSTLKKVLKNVAIKNPGAELVSKAKLDFAGFQDQKEQRKRKVIR
jgi:hypothetical protein